ncbi:MAG: response regulator, partial [Thermoplasmata archaeon]
MAQILVVEDNPQNLKLTTIILQSGGHTVTTAVDSEAAERALEASLPDLILMDVALPGKDGYALTREFRQRPEMHRMPILALSAFAMPGDAEKAFAAGCSDYLTKPIRRAVLLDRVALLLRRSGFAPRRSAPAADPPAVPNVAGDVRSGAATDAPAARASPSPTTSSSRTEGTV